MAKFEPEMTLGDARALLFERSGFAADGGYQDRWVRVNLWRIPLWFPNTAGRRRAVKFHDLHHVLTEYPTTWRGETQIGAWEVATGLRCYYVGWLLDLLGFAVGLVINPAGVYRAFTRGRRSANMYGMEWDERILSCSVGAMRRRLRLDREAVDERATRRDKLAFLMWALVSIVTYLLTAAVLTSPLLVLSLVMLRLAGWI